MKSFNSKALLFGEYSVLHGSMALVMPCERYSGQLNFWTGGSQNKFARQSNEYLKKFSDFIADHIDENFVLEVKQLEREIENGLFFQSNIPQGYGLGSSGALVVAIFLRYLKKTKVLKDELKELTMEKVQQLKTGLAHLESFFHGISSGLDPLSIILNQPMLYKNDLEVLLAEIPDSKEDGNNVIFLLNTGIARMTSSLMEKFNEVHKAPAFRKKINDELVEYTNDSINAFLYGPPEGLYKNLNKLVQFQLEEMNSFIPTSFQKPIKRGLSNGDYFLKLCGAGGGGFMLGFTDNWSKTSEELRGHDLEIIHRY